jgi:hypothetical protein
MCVVGIWIELYNSPITSYYMYSTITTTETNFRDVAIVHYCGAGIFNWPQRTLLPAAVNRFTAAGIGGRIKMLATVNQFTTVGNLSCPSQ